jgi:hypothetical protein
MQTFYLPASVGSVNASTQVTGSADQQDALKANLTIALYNALVDNGLAAILNDTSQLSIVYFYNSNQNFPSSSYPYLKLRWHVIAANMDTLTLYDKISAVVYTSAFAETLKSYVYFDYSSLTSYAYTDLWSSYTYKTTYYPLSVASVVDSILTALEGTSYLEVGYGGNDCYLEAVFTSTEVLNVTGTYAVTSPSSW